MTEPAGFETTDVGLAAAIVVAGQPLAGTGRGRHGHRVLRFANTEELMTAVTGNWSGSLMVPARRYADELRALRALVTSAKREVDG
jgi:hypothetical protein